MSWQKSRYLALSGAVLFWGFAFIGTKLALRSFSPFVCVFLRLVVASLFFIPLLAGGRNAPLTRRQHLKLLLLSLSEPGLYFSLETIGIQYTTATKASIIIAIIPLVVLILARLFLGEPLNRSKLISILLSFVGIAILVLGDPNLKWSWQGSLIGDLLILLAVISAAFYTILARNLGRRVSPVIITGYQFLYGSLFFAPLFLWSLPRMDWERVTLLATGSLAFLALFATVGAYSLYNYALSKTPAAQAALFLNGIPLITAIASWFILGERLTVLQIGGGLLVLAAVYLATIPARRLPPWSIK